MRGRADLANAFADNGCGRTRDDSALVEGRYEDVVTAARMGQVMAGTSSAMVQLTLQEARGLARIGDRREADRAEEHARETIQMHAAWRHRDACTPGDPHT